MLEKGTEVYTRLLERVQQLADSKIDAVRLYHPHVYHESEAKEATLGLSKGQMIVDIILDEFDYFQRWLEQKDD